MRPMDFVLHLINVPQEKTQGSSSNSVVKISERPLWLRNEIFCSLLRSIWRSLKMTRISSSVILKVIKVFFKGKSPPQKRIAIFFPAKKTEVFTKTMHGTMKLTAPSRNCHKSLGSAKCSPTPFCSWPNNSVSVIACPAFSLCFLLLLSIATPQADKTMNLAVKLTAPLERAQSEIIYFPSFEIWVYAFGEILGADN